MSAATIKRELQESKSINEINKKLSTTCLWKDQYRSEKCRLKTFENWPLDWLDKNTLAKTGMFYLGEEDRTKCYFCNVVICKWELTDDPIQEHLRWSPNCPLLKRCRTNNEPLDNLALDCLLPGTEPRTYDTPPAWKMKSFTDYSIKANRLQTFVDWPISLKQKPEQLAEAGFFYNGIGDNVVCFSCLGGLKDWEDDDDPWEQHALWMGHYCPYVKHIKGKEFIEKVVNKFQNRSSSLANSEEKDSAIEEEQQLDDYKLCKICFDKECNSVYIPCGHVIACMECAFLSKECPLCRLPVERTVRLYFS
ncbi:death-associated inhibitor of apoptosis 1-like [Cochliomyia hominivorax]